MAPSFSWPARANLCATLAYQGRSDEALELARSLVAETKEGSDPDGRYSLGLRVTASLAVTWAGRPEEAVAIGAPAIKALEAGTPQRMEMTEAVLAVAPALTELNRPAEAVRLLRRGLELSNLLEDDPVPAAQLQGHLARALAATGASAAEVAAARNESSRLFALKPHGAAWRAAYERRFASLATR
jgi:hypothetical protein